MLRPLPAAPELDIQVSRAGSGFPRSHSAPCPPPAATPKHAHDAYPEPSCNLTTCPDLAPPCQHPTRSPERAPDPNPEHHGCVPARSPSPDADPRPDPNANDEAMEIDSASSGSQALSLFATTKPGT